jgi:hypothetical protein
MPEYIAEYTEDPQNTIEVICQNDDYETLNDIVANIPSDWDIADILLEAILDYDALECFKVILVHYILPHDIIECVFRFDAVKILGYLHHSPMHVNYFPEVTVWTDQCCKYSSLKCIKYILDHKLVYVIEMARNALQYDGDKIITLVMDNYNFYPSEAQFIKQLVQAKAFNCMVVMIGKLDLTDQLNLWGKAKIENNQNFINYIHAFLTSIVGLNLN